VERIEDYFARMDAMIMRHDAVELAGVYEYPCQLIDDTGTLSFRDSRSLSAFFEGLMDYLGQFKKFHCKILNVRPFGENLMVMDPNAVAKGLDRMAQARPIAMKAD